MRDRTFKISGIRVGAKGRRLDRNIDFGRSSPVLIRRFVLAQRAPACLGHTQALEQGHVAVYVLGGLRIADRGLAQDVQGKGKALLTQFFEVLDGVVDSLANDELQGHHLQVFPNALAQHLGAQLTCQARTLGPQA